MEIAITICTAIVSGLFYVSYKHPAGYKNLHKILYAAILCSILLMMAWNLIVFLILKEAWDQIKVSNPGVDYKVIIGATKRLEIPFLYGVIVPAVSMIALWIISKITDIILDRTGDKK